jgi:hypothetical protein
MLHRQDAENEAKILQVPTNSIFVFPSSLRVFVALPSLAAALPEARPANETA